MKKINFPMLLLAMLVVLMFCLVGVAMAYQNYLLIILFVLLGFGFMGFGIYKKRKSDY
ncbi:DUF5325 family protein [Pseudogracilibacillus sp. SO30301A]|uniref:DUF5325 family protein n=1 Tax=Pseudogracilibacillus sp. SO30301A TaxID=3098291 RepID=UPI00300E05A2